RADSDLFLYAAFLLVFLILWSVVYAVLPAFRHISKIVADAITRASVRWARVGRLTDRFGAYVPVALIVIAGGVLTAVAGDNFIDLAEMVHAKSVRLQDFDVLAHSWAVAHRTGGATDFFTVMTIIGGPAGVGTIAMVTAVVLLLTKRFRWVIYLAVAIAGGALLNMELKRYFARARPALAEMLRQAHGYSFPSGHAMDSTVVYASLSYLAFRTATHWRWKAASLALAMTLILAVALSRVYLGAHWISDVAAGIAAGTMWVAVTTVAYETLRRIRRLRARVAVIPSAAEREESGS